MEFIISILEGALYGLVISAGGYVKNIGTEKFSVEKSAITIAIGLIIGAIFGIENLDVDTIQLITTYIVNALLIRIGK